MSRSNLRALLLTCGALCAAVLMACGAADEGDSAARKTISQTFDSSATSIERATIDARLQLDPEGLLAIGGPIVLKLDGPFSDSGALDLAFAATLAGEQYEGAIISTGKKAFLRLDDRTYALGGGSGPKHGGGAGKQKSGLKESLGIDPGSWISNPQGKGNEQVGGVDTERIGGDVNVAKLLADVATLLDGASASKSGAGFLTPTLRKQIADAVRSATVDVWTGAKDKILRQIAVAIQFEFPAGEKPPIAGLEAGKINLRVRLDDVNGAAVNVPEPENARPLAKLPGGGLDDFLAGIGASFSGSGGGRDFLGCVTTAAGRSEELVRCVAALAP